jgi:serine/threonine-protein kinase
VENLPAAFGRYELIELIATGGMAHIFRARLGSAEGTSKELVIKRVLPHLLENRDFIDMFVDEARITMPLTHGNIVQVFEFGQEGPDYFLAMEFVHGRNLETVLKCVEESKQQLPLPIALFISSEVAKGLDYAHRFRDPHDRPTGIIHRDVSPQNILVGFQGEVKLTDFGIAKAKSRIRTTSQGIIRGKASYLSPEQAECTELDGRSDQFSLGAVLYEMITGVRPFDGETEIATLQKVRDTIVQAPSRLRPEIPSEIDGLILKALSREPDRRFENAGAFQVVLARELHKLGPEFTSATLADWMRELYLEDLNREVISRTTKERLLEQLAHKPSGIDHTSLTTAEILQMGTLALHQDGSSAADKGQRNWFLMLALIVLLGAGFGVLAGWSTIKEWFTGGELVSSLVVDGSDGSTQEEITLAEEPQAPDAGVATAEDAGVLPAADKPVIRYGYLNLNASPWALVEIDGRRLKKETPLFKVRVRAGRHRLRFFNPELKIEKWKTIWVKPNRTRTVSVKLTEP